MDTLQGQVALVTGGGRGIGRAVAERLASEGMALVLLARSADQLVEAKLECERRGVSVATMPVDVRDAEEVKRAVGEAQSELGAVDLLVSSAGVWLPPMIPPWGEGFDDWWGCIETNLKGALAVAAAVLPGMWERGRGRIVHMNSRNAGRDNSGPYSVSKAGLSRLTGVLAARGAERGICVFDVSPGLVRTAMTDNPGFAHVPDDEWTPISRIGELVAAIATGRLDRLSGRFIHAQDDLDLLVREADGINARDGRKLRFTPAYDGDEITA